MSSAEVDLGGCGGCGLGCALTCTRQSSTADRARRVLVATGVGLVLLSLAPGLVAGGWYLLPAAATSLLGAAVALLAAHAVRSGRPAGDGAARWGYRLVPAGMTGLLLTWVAVLVGALVG